MNTVQPPRTPFDPPVYFCPRAKEKPIIDGNLDKPFWQNVPFTEAFTDISGPNFPAPRFATRAKMCWDDDNLYIGALLEGDEIWATLTQRDSVIYLDNDFEIFIDTSSSTHDYLEIEVNALNTQWDLLLTRPYRDGGRAISAWDIAGLESAVTIQGKLNDPTAHNRFWSVEVRLPLKPLMEGCSLVDNPPELPRCYQPRNAPCVGEFWRMNFSRVQWTVDVKEGRYQKRLDENGAPLPEDNWVWAPTGKIDIHCPEFWGFVFFTEAGEPYAVPENEKRKLALRQLYYAQHVYHKRHGCYCADLDALGVPLPPYNVTVAVTPHGFELNCPDESGQGFVCMLGDGYTFVTD